MNPEIACVLLVFLDDPDREWHATDMSARARCPEYLARRIVALLVAAGWVMSRIEADNEGSYVHYHRLTDTGVRKAMDALRYSYLRGTPLMLMAYSVHLPLDLVTRVQGAGRQS